MDSSMTKCCQRTWKSIINCSKALGLSLASGSPAMLSPIVSGSGTRHSLR